MDFSAVCKAASAGKVTNIKAMLEKARALSPDGSFPSLMPRAGRSPLLLAAQHGREEVARYLVDTFRSRTFIDQTGTADFTSSQLHRCTALTLAAIGGHESIVSLLLLYGASTSITDCLSCTPLCEAVYHKHPEVVRCLLANGADASAVNTFGFTPLHVAVVQGSVAIVKILLDHGASLDQAAPGGHTAMHLASQWGHEYVVKCLLDRGASPRFPDPSSPLPFADDYTPCPLFLAAEKGHRRTAQLLLALSECPASCAVDAWLLLGAFAAQLPGFKSELKHSWHNAFSRHRSDNGDSDLIPACYHFPSPHSSAPLLRTTLPGVEQFATLKACNELLLSGPSLSIFHQCLLVQDRCVGVRGQMMFDQLARTAEEACAVGQLAEAEDLLRASLHLVETDWLSALQSGHKLPRNVAGSLRQLVREPAAAILVVLIDSRFPSTSLMADFVESAFRITEGILARDRAVHAEFGCQRESRSLALESLLLLFNVWLYHTSQARGAEGGIERCEALGRRLISDYLLPEPGETPLLHVAICPTEPFSQIMSSNKSVVGTLRSYARWCHKFTLFESLLEWGGWRGVNIPGPPLGNRPLHLAARQARSAELISLLLVHGAHPDAVNRNGETAAEMLSAVAVPSKALLAPPSPVPLACQAACCVLASNLDYAASDYIPPRLKEILRLHDTRSLNDFSADQAQAYS